MDAIGGMEFLESLRFEKECFMMLLDVLECLFAKAALTGHLLLHAFQPCRQSCRMVGRRSSAGHARRARTPSMSQIQWRRASATQIFEMESVGITGGNGFIDPHKAIEKLKLHGAGLWGMQISVVLLMTPIAVIAGERIYSWGGFVVLAILFDIRYGLTYWYSNTSAGGKLRDMQYAWACFNALCAFWGVWVYLQWNEAIEGVHRDKRIFRQKVHIWASYFTWAFGIWTSAVVVVGFESYSFTGNYPMDLTCCFLGALASCLISDVWAIGKLCSLGTYTAQLEEEWRLAPHEPSAPPLSAILQSDLEQAMTRDSTAEEAQAGVQREGHIGGNGNDEPTREPKSTKRRSSGAEAGASPRRVEGGAEDREGAATGQNVRRDAPSALALSEDDTLLPHAFERLWGALATQGEFQTRVTEAVPQSSVVRHLCDRGFQVVAAGTSEGLMRVLFCAKEATNNGTGTWFLAELLHDERALTLEARFKSITPDVVPGFVQSFMLHRVFTMAGP